MPAFGLRPKTTRLRGLRPRLNVTSLTSIMSTSGDRALPGPKGKVLRALLSCARRIMDRRKRADQPPRSRRSDSRASR